MLAKPASFRHSRRTTQYYTPEQVSLIVAHQTPENAISTELVYHCGMRANELYTIRRGDERAITSRPFPFALHQGRSGIVYTVMDLHGVVREIIVSPELSEKLETFRLDNPVHIVDRKVNTYEIVYDISGGKRWSDSFSSVSKRELHWTQGGRCLRLTYESQRVRMLQRDYTYELARAIVREEIGRYLDDPLKGIDQQRWSLAGKCQ